VRLGEVVIGREDAQSALEAWERADQHFRRGTLGQERSVGAHRRARVAGNGRGVPGKLVARYLRKEDETDMALLKRRAAGEVVPEIPADAVLPMALERRRKDVKPAPAVRA